MTGRAGPEPPREADSAGAGAGGSGSPGKAGVAPRCGGPRQLRRSRGVSPKQGVAVTTHGDRGATAASAGVCVFSGFLVRRAWMRSVDSELLELAWRSVLCE